MEQKLSTRHVHLFSKFGLYLAYDIDHVKIYRVNPLAHSILEQATGQTQDQLEVSLVTRYPLEDIRRVFSSLLKARLLGFGVPVLPQEQPDKNSPPHMGLNKIVLAVTDLCNLACKYCLSSPPSYTPQHHMKPETACRAVDFLLAQMAANSTANIVFYGGEPLLNFLCIQQTVLYAQQKALEHRKSFTFSLITNGTLLTSEISNFLVQHHFAIGLSLDGDHSIHDVNRKFPNGRDTHAIVLKNYQELMQKGADVTPQAVLSLASRDILQLVNSMFAQGVRNYKLIPRMRPDGEVELIADETADYCYQYSRMVENKLQEGDSTPVLLPIDLFPLLDKIDRGLKSKSSCSASLSQVAISPSGDICPCDNFLYQPEFNMGNVHAEFKTDLQETFKRIGVANIAQCRECWAQHLCGGPCPYFSLKKHGRLDTTVSSVCIQTQNTMEIALAVYTLCKAKNKNFLADWLKKR